MSLQVFARSCWTPPTARNTKASCSAKCATRASSDLRATVSAAALAACRWTPGSTSRIRKYRPVSTAQTRRPRPAPLRVFPYLRSQWPVRNNINRVYIKLIRIVERARLYITRRLTIAWPVFVYVATGIERAAFQRTSGRGHAPRPTSGASIARHTCNLNYLS